ncbi:MAG: CDP-alcohol phosphatidyltransferase family protein [Bdellovibrionales bacterium]|nr:CDP-alcohol phosphatidyltransferase family protein [Bdellovibrionales bacterium]
MENRRDLSSRDIGFFQKMGGTLVKLGLTPNQISVMSVVFAALSAYGFYHLSPDSSNVWLYWFLAFAGIQMRLFCNLIDGLMAIEGGKKTPAGEIFNDFPDRISDVIIILGASLAIPYVWGKDLGWVASVLAVFTAYIRVLGAAMGKGHDFRGPMAKQHRMFILNVTLVAWMIEYYFTHTNYALVSGMCVVAVGSLFTIINRLRVLVGKLNS